MSPPEPSFQINSETGQIGSFVDPWLAPPLHLEQGHCPGDQSLSDLVRSHIENTKQQSWFRAVLYLRREKRVLSSASVSISSPQIGVAHLIIPAASNPSREKRIVTGTIDR